MNWLCCLTTFQLLKLCCVMQIKGEGEGKGYKLARKLNFLTIRDSIWPDKVIRINVIGKVQQLC